MATVNDILNHPVPFTYMFCFHFLPAHTHKHTCSLCFMLTLAGWMKSSFSRDKGSVSSTYWTALFCTPQTDPCHEIPPVYFSSKSKTCKVVCVCTYHTLNIQNSHISCFIGGFVLPVLTNIKRTIAKSGLTTLHISLILLWFSPYIHYVETVLFTVPLRPIYVNGLCYDWLTYLNVSYGVVHQGGLNSWIAFDLLMCMDMVVIS